MLEVRYRLPGFWEEVASGRLPWWRAARVAEHTLALPKAGARYVDRRLAKTAARVTFGQVERLTAEALRPVRPRRSREPNGGPAMEARRVDIDTRDVGPDGVVEISGGLDLADALDLDTALDHGAAELGALGCTETHDVRRSLALGALADVRPSSTSTPTTRTGRPGRWSSPARP